VFNRDIILAAGISQEKIDKVVAKESAELLRRNRLYRGNEPAPDLKDRIVILIDDGIATGATMHAAIHAVKQRQPLRTIVAAPVASQEAYATLGQQADEIVCPHTPALFLGVGRFYENFGQTSDKAVIILLVHARHWGKGHVHFEVGHRC
jgi:putative phosphoribosyl transferase